MGSCFCCHFRQPFSVSLAFVKCKKDFKIFKIILGQGFCILKTETPPVPIRISINTCDRGLRT